VAPTDHTIGQAGATVLTAELQAHDRDITLALLDEAGKADLDLMAARLAPDQQSHIGLEIVAGGREIGHTAATKSWGTVTMYQGASNSTSYAP
jgi:hypothetical protein